MSNLWCLKHPLKNLIELKEIKLQRKIFLLQRLAGLHKTNYLKINNRQHLHTNLHHTQKHAQEILPKPDIQSIIEKDMQYFFTDIKQILKSSKQSETLRPMCNYNFDGSGKSVRPTTVFLMSRACNIHQKNKSTVLKNQRKIAQIAEMIHAGSLVHDDVVDLSSVRRGKHSVNSIWGDKKAVLAGNYIMGKASHLLSTTQNTLIVETMSNIIIDLVNGELMQQDTSDKFEQYLSRIYKKTASLFANSCKSVAILSGASDHIVNAAYCYGRDIGLAFQLIDDLLDFEQTESELGKPSSADLSLGIATAPVLFACTKHPFLNDLILRKFSKLGDIEKAQEAVINSDGVKETLLLAHQHCNDACGHLKHFVSSNELRALESISYAVLNRTK